MSASTQVSFSVPGSTIRQGDQSQQASSANPLPIAPKPGPLGLSIVTSDPADESPSSLPSTSTSGTERRVYSFSAAPEYPTPSSSVAARPQQLDINFDTVDRSHIPEPRSSKRSPPQQTTHYDFDALHIKKEIKDELSTTPARTSSLDWSAGPTSASLSSQELFYDSNRQFPAAASFFQSYTTNSTWQQPTPISASAGPSFHDSYFDPEVHFASSEQFPGDSENRTERDDDYPQPDLRPTHIPQTIDRTVEEEAAVSQQYQIEDDEDPYDVSDEDVDMDEYENDGAWQGQLQDSHLQNNNLGIVVALQARQESHDLRVRSITSFIDRPNMLATYTPSPQSSPLNDSMTARLFCHFIHVTAPSISMFERHPANPSLIFQGQPVPKAQQHVWTCKS
jgi:hypothetical protein